MKNILILGFGKSGKAVFDYFVNKNVNIFVYDKKFTCNIQRENKEKNNKKLKNNTKNNKKIIYFSDFVSFCKYSYNICIISPGFDTNSKEVKFLKKNHIKIQSELEFGMNLCKGKVFCITGTNGKTTTVSLLYEIFKNAHKKTFLCGNIGTPITEIAPQTTKHSLIVCEVSSFQLEYSENIKPFATAILNITPDHLDRHKSIKKYIEIKEKINKYYKSYKVFNNFDNNCQKISKIHNNAVLINKKNIKNNKLYLNNELIVDFSTAKLFGNKNKENVAVACALAKFANVDKKYIQKAIQNFSGLPHRLEVVKKHNGVEYINDSKSTNIDSALFALSAIKETTRKKITLLLGGSDKNLDFKPIFEQNLFNKVIIYGQTKEKILSDMKNYYCNYFVENNFENACKKAFEISKENSVVLLSPASASFDEFTGYEQRGEKFVEYVEKFCNINT